MAQRKFPDALTLIVGIMVIFMILTWLLPAGSFERTEKEVNGLTREVVVPGTYAEVKQSPQSPWDVLIAPLKGFAEAADIIGFVFFVGGAFAIINRTGAINSGLMQVVRFSEKNPAYKKLIIPLVMTLFSLGGATFGMSEETLVFVMITIPLAHAMGYDAVVGLAIPFIGSGVGFAGAFSNPFTIGIAQGLAEIPLFSGYEYRLIVWTIFTIVGITFVMIYANRVEKNPHKSLVYGMDTEMDFAGVHKDEDLRYTPVRKVILALLAVAIGMIIVGATRWDWYINEISALFIGLGIVVAVIYRLGISETLNSFYQGCKDVLVAAIIIGFSRGILVIAEDGQIIDTILHGISTAAEGLPNYLSVQIMFVVQTGINFFIPSGSGQAALTMPIMAPLADLLGITRQTAVLAYQFGDGISNIIIPTSGVVMGLLSISKIPYDKWFRFAFPLIIILSVVAMLLLIPPTTFYTW